MDWKEDQRSTHLHCAMDNRAGHLLILVYSFRFKSVPQERFPRNSPYSFVRDKIRF
jgi:hypothetical protein